MRNADPPHAKRRSGYALQNDPRHSEALATESNPQQLRQERGFSTLPIRAYSPRNFMKIVESQSTMGDRRERRGRTHSGAVEAVTLSDPERA